MCSRKADGLQCACQYHTLKELRCVGLMMREHQKKHTSKIRDEEINRFGKRLRFAEAYMAKHDTKSDLVEIWPSKWRFLAWRIKAHLR